jgi:Predicted integral membrane protein
MTPSRRRLLRGAAIMVMVALLGWFATTVSWRAAASVLRSADPRLIAAALVLNLLSLGIKGIRWWIFLRPIGVRSLSLALRATVAGASLNNLVVAQGGEGARVLAVSRAAGVSSTGVLAALGVERALDLVTYLVLLVGTPWLLDLPPHLARWRATAAGVLLVAAVVVAVLLLIPRRAPPATIVQAPGGVRGYLRRVGGGAAQVATASRLSAGMVLSLAAWALQIATYHVAALAAHLSLPLAGSVAAVLSVGASFLVRATPGNVGVFQMIYALTARSFGVAEGPAVAVALLIQTLQVVPVVVLGTIVAPGLMRARK